MISSKIVQVPVVGEAGDRRADAHDRRADREVLALERERRRERLEPGLRRRRTCRGTGAGARWRRTR